MRGRGLRSLSPYLCWTLLAGSLLLASKTWGQNYHCTSYAFRQTIALDTLPIELGSVTTYPEVAFTISDNRQFIEFGEELVLDSIRICFRTISHQIRKPMFNRDITRYERGYYQDRNRAEEINIPKAKLFQFGDLATQGAITRGISFGNRQNVFVNSALNLQMEGRLSEDLRIEAVMTDQNIPYQPEGNTQQIRDFDNVFIKLYNERFEVIAGDIVLQNPVENGYFLKYNKNVQGLSVGYRKELHNGWKSSTRAVGSVAKGQFTSAVIEPEEGVQGPYKLRGNNGERFVIIMANSEKIYLDGHLLQRGFDRDYVIDYNLGEITFSATVVITQYSRIRVDFEYANQYYSRSNLSASQEFRKGKSRVYVNFYREKDNPNNSLAFDLSDQDKLALAQVGDVDGLAAISGVDSTGYIENAILYARIASAGSTYYQASNDADVALYQVSFSEVGEGNGSYVVTGTTSNGRVYEWVGEGQGTYEPIQQIPAPNQRQMVIGGTQIGLGNYESLFAEMAWSNQDRNLFSRQDDEDNRGWATKVALRSNGRKFWDHYRLDSELSFEFNHQQFAFIDRFRSVDFDRDWGYDYYSDTVPGRQDLITRWHVALTQNRQNQVAVDASYRKRSKVVDGTKLQGVLNKRIGKLQVSSEHYLMENAFGGYESRWFKSYDQVQWMDWLVKPGYRLELDHQQTSVLDTDSIVGTLMNYRMHNWFVETGDSSKLAARLDYIRRLDFKPSEGQLETYTHAQEYRVGLSSRALANHRVSVTAKYREVDYQDQSIADQQNLLGVIQWDGRLLDQHVRSNFSFNTSNARELRREYVFVQVATGEGTHTWRDENSDGVQDLNEFYEAVNQDEREYIKLFTPTDEYIQAYQTTYVYAMSAQMPRGWKNGNGWQTQLSRLALSTNIKYHFKTSETDLLKRINPYHAALEDTSFVSASNLMRHTLFYNRNAPGAGFDVTHAQQRTKNLLNGGFELKEKEEWVGNARIGYGKFLTVRGKGGVGEMVNTSDFLASRNFVLKSYSYGGQLVVQPMNKLRLIGGWTQRNKVTSGQEDQSQIEEYRSEVTWVRPGKGNVNASFSWIQIDFTGDESSYLGYELLEALQPGANQRWNVNWQQSIGLGLQLSLQYNGRKSESSPAVHTGSVSVTAYF